MTRAVLDLLTSIYGREAVEDGRLGGSQSRPVRMRFLELGFCLVLGQAPKATHYRHAIRILAGGLSFTDSRMIGI